MHGLGLEFGSAAQLSKLYRGMSKIYQVEYIYEVYLYYQIKICVHLTYLSFTLGVPDTLISNIYMPFGYRLEQPGQCNTTV